MAKKTHHVVPSSTGGWEVKKAGVDRAPRHFETKAEAIDAGREIAKSQGGEFIIHGNTGQIIQATSFRTNLRENDVRAAVRSVSKDSKSNTKKYTKAANELKDK